MPHHRSRELVITVPLPDDKGRRGDARPKVRRFRSHWLELGQRLREFRAHSGITQPEIAAAASAGNASTVAQWGRGVNVLEGLRREYLIELLEGRRWRALRAAASVGEGLPETWGRGVRWYRRASRERRPRGMVGAAVAAILEELRAAPRSRPCASGTVSGMASGCAAWRLGGGSASRTRSTSGA